MKSFIVSSILFFLFCTLSAQEITLSGEKYEQDYQPLDQGVVLTDTSTYWEGFSEFYEPSPPVSFFSGALSFQEVDLDEIGLFLFAEELAEISIFPLYVGSEDYDIWEVSAHSPEDTIAEIGQIRVQETDTSFTVEYSKVAYTLYNFNTDSLLFLDIQFTFQVQLDYKNDKVRYHFGEIVLGPEAETQMQELSIISGIFTGFEFSEGELQLPFIFADGDPAMPEFFAGEGFFEELPPFFIEDFPEEGTVYEFSMDVMTSTEEVSVSETLSVWPNPGYDQLTISYSAPDFSYEVRNAAGDLVQEVRAQRTARILTANWPAGVYFVSVGRGKQVLSELWIKYE